MESKRYCSFRSVIFADCQGYSLACFAVYDYYELSNLRFSCNVGSFNFKQLNFWNKFFFSYYFVRFAFASTAISRLGNAEIFL